MEVFSMTLLNKFILMEYQKVDEPNLMLHGLRWNDILFIAI